jgi:hypothetical protein
MSTMFQSRLGAFLGWVDGGRAALTQRTAAVVAGLSLMAASIHLLVAPEHFAEWWAYGAFFVAAAVAEVALMVAVARRPRGGVLHIGVWLSLATMLMYLVSRTRGIPLGPHAGVVEGIDGLGLEATVAEGALAVVLCTLMDGTVRRRTINALCVGGVALWTAAAAGVLTPPPDAIDGHGGVGSVHRHGPPVLPEISDAVRNAPRPAGIG